MPRRQMHMVHTRSTGAPGPSSREERHMSFVRNRSKAAKRRVQNVDALRKTVDEIRVLAEATQHPPQEIAQWVEEKGKCYLCQEVCALEDSTFFACGHAVHTKCLSEADRRYSDAVFRVMTLNLTNAMDVEVPSLQAGGRNCGICNQDISPGSKARVTAPSQILSEDRCRPATSEKGLQNQIDFLGRHLAEWQKFHSRIAALREGAYTDHLQPPSACPMM